MNKLYKQYKLTLETKGPVHIGNGNTLTKKDYYFDNENNTVKVFDFNDIKNIILEKSGLDYYKKFYSSDKKSFNNLVDDDLELNINDLVPNYSIDQTFIRNNISEIRQFVRNASGQLYVPGSSLKGMIKNVLYSYFAWSTNKQNFDEIDDNWLGNESAKKIFNQYTEIIENNNWFGSLKVNDSSLIANNKLSIVQVYDVFSNDYKYNKNKTKLKPGYRPIFLECLVPETNIEFIIEFDKFPLREDFIDFVVLALRNYYHIMNNSYLNHFFASSSNSNNNNNNNYDNIKLDKHDILIGAKSGFASKTYWYPLMRDNAVEEVSEIFTSNEKKSKNELTRQKKIHENDSEVFGISPHAVSCGIKHDLLIGRCSYSIEEI